MARGRPGVCGHCYFRIEPDLTPLRKQLACTCASGDADSAAFFARQGAGQHLERDH